jgi:hypothetical protein
VIELVCGYCAEPMPGRYCPTPGCPQAAGNGSPNRPTMIAAPHARRAPTDDEESTSTDGERRRCRRCTARIEPDAVEGERFPSEAAAWLAGFCTSRCMERDAIEAVATKTAWWLGGGR